MNVQKYLTRINYHGSLKPNSLLLKEIHHKHVEHIPFENINNYLGLPVSLELDALYAKIIMSKRGGYCYELNGLFHQLLLEMGFDTRLLAAKLYDDENLLEHSLHAVIHVKLENQDWLLDVGYGSDGQLYPLIINDQEQWQKDNLYKLSKNANEIILSRFKVKTGWRRIMRINLDKIDLSFFNLRNLYHQENNESMFKRNFICSVYSENFSKSIKNLHYSFIEGENTLLQTINEDRSFLNILERDFAIKISKDMSHALLATKCI